MSTSAQVLLYTGVIISLSIRSDNEKGFLSLILSRLSNSMPQILGQLEQPTNCTTWMRTA